MISGIHLATALSVMLHMEQEGNGMKTSDLSKAYKIKDDHARYLSIIDKITGYTGYEAYLLVDGHKIPVVSTVAIAIIDDLLDANKRRMEEIGLEYDE